MAVLLGVEDKSVLKVGSMIAVGLSLANKYVALAGTKGEIVMYNLESQKPVERMLIEQQCVCLDWAGNSGLIIGDQNGAVHLFL